MSNPLNRELEPITLNVVPNSFTPVPEQYEQPVTQHLRDRQGQLTRGFTLQQVSNLENQLRKSPYKRDARWFSGAPGQQSKLDAKLAEAIKIAKTARTIMEQEIATWAGSLSETELMKALPDIWHRYVQIVDGQEEIPAPDGADDTLNLEDVDPIQVIYRLDVPEDAPRTTVEPPKQLTLGEVLGKIAMDNAKD